MAYCKLKEDHPVQKKVRKIERMMEDMGIYLSVGVGGQIFVSETGNDEYYYYLDSENTVGGYETTQNFPLGLETKLVK